MKIFQLNFSLFIIISLLSICLIKNAEILYSLKISYERPVMSKDYIFYLKGFEINALNKNYYSSYNMFGNTYRKPLMSKFNEWGDTVFFTKDCRLEMWEDQGKDTLQGHKLFSRTFQELWGDYCYDTLEMFYDDNRNDIAVYNTHNNKIIVFNLNYIDYERTNHNIVGKVEMTYNINQALIYNYDESTSILIGIDSLTINFYNLRGAFSWKDYFFNYRLIKSITLNRSFYSSMGQKIAGIMEIDNKKDKLLFIDSRVYLYDMKEFKIISSLFIPNPSVVLTLHNGNALIGNDNGIIHLLKYNNGNLDILAQYKICGGKVMDISYDNNKYYYSNNNLIVQCDEENGYFLKHILL